MLDEKIMTYLEAALRRIFAMKVTRSTLRELQNMLLTITNGNRDLANQLFETLFTGEIKEGLTGKGVDRLKVILPEFSVLVRLSKEVLERGEFINIITSDIISQKEDVGFLNRIRRIDGDEFLFLTDTESTIHILHHLTARLQEIEKSEPGKDQLRQFKKELLSLRNKIDSLAK